MPRFTRLKHQGVSDERRLPRLGKIRLGIKKKSQRSGNEYPAEVDYFVVPPEVAKVYGDKPKMLDVMVPLEDVEVVMPVALKYYKAAGLFCIGDGENAARRDEKTGQMQEIECPCPFLDQPGKCRRMAVINVILPKVNMGGVYQIVTGSWNSIVDFQSGMDYVRGMLGRCSFVPLKLERVPTDVTHTDAKGKTSKQTHYTLRLTFEGDIDFINRLKGETNRILAGPQYRLPAPEVNPVLDPVDVVVVDEAEDDEEIRDTEATVIDDAPKPADRPPDGPKPTGRGRGRKPAKPAPTAPADPAPASDPADAAGGQQAGSGASQGPTLAEVPGVWKNVKACFGDNAEAFWKFALNVYFGVEKSTDVSAADATPFVERLAKCVTAGDETARSDAANGMWEEMRIEVDERGAAASEEAPPA